MVLVPLLTNPFIKFSVIISTYILKSIDHGWLEILGGQGSFSMVMVLSKINQIIQFKMFNFLVMFMVMLMIIMYFVFVKF